MLPKVFLTLEGVSTDPGELGPFDSISISNLLKINGSVQSCASFADGLWTITDGAALGNEELTGTQWPIILGQAKLQ